jgi:dCTP deaminase
LASESLFHYGQPTGDGILPSQEILELVRSGKISSTQEITEDQIQPSSIDLRLSNVAYKVRASFLPGKSATLLNRAKANRMLMETIDISGGAILEPGVIYIIPLMENLTLPASVYGIANPKSSTGRLDIFTRLITECGDEFERVPKGYSGGLFIEVLSQTFRVLVRSGMKLNQLRFGRGRRSAVGEERLRWLDRKDLLIDPDEEESQAKVDRGLRLTLDLQGNSSGIVGYQAKKTSQVIDLGLIGHYEIPDFWNPIFKDQECILQPGEFYILVSKQRVRIPPDLAAEMLPYDLSTQEFRVHYAGFFDPGFGYGTDGEIPGTRAVLEVRASEMPILLEDDQFVGRLTYYNMSEKPQKVYGGVIGSNYQQQGLTLSKQFKREAVTFDLGTSPGQTQIDDPGSARRQEAREPSTTDIDDEFQKTGRRFAFPETDREYMMKAKSV